MPEDPEITVGLLAARFDDEYPDSAAEWVADRAVRSIRPPARTRLLADLLRDRIESRRRVRAHSIEQRAAQLAAQAAIAQERAQEKADFKASHAAECSIQHRGYDDGYEAAKACADVLRRSSPEGRAAIEQRRQVAAMRKTLNEQEAEEQAARDRLWEEDPDEWNRRYSFFGMLTRALETFRSQVRLELTTELLGSAFALGDGRQVTWGSATVDDHTQRMELLGRGIEGTAQTIFLHEKAIEIIREHNAANLSEVRWAA